MKKNKKKPATYRCALCDTKQPEDFGIMRLIVPGAYGKTCFNCCDILDRRVRNQRIKNLLGELYDECVEHQDEILALIEELDDDYL